MATKNQLAVIHILKKEYNLSDNDYTSIMFDLFDETSAKFLDEEQAEKFIHTLNYKYDESYNQNGNGENDDYIDSNIFTEENIQNAFRKAIFHKRKK